MPDFFKNRWPLFLVLILFIVAKIPYLLYPYYWDESWPYVPAVMAMHQHGASLLPTALPPDLSRGHPLFFHSIYALWMDVFGSTYKSLHSFALFISLLFLIAIYETGYRIFNKRVAIISLILVATNMYFYVQSTFVLPEILVAFLSFLSICLYAARKYAYAALSLTALFLTKESGVIAGFVIGVDGLIALFNTREQLKERLLKLIPPAIACISLGLFLVIQKHYNGWYVFPLHSDEILNKWPDILYRFRTCSLRTTFYDQYEYFLFFALILYSIIAIVKLPGKSSLLFSLLLIPVTLTYYFVDDGRSANFDLNTGIITFAAFIIFYIATLFSFANARYYSNAMQRRFILLSGFFVLGYVLFSSVVIFIVRYELAGIIAVLFLLAVLFDMLVRHSYRVLYYPVLAIILTVAFFCFKDDKGWGDCNLGFKYGVKTQQAVVEFMERSNFYDKHIASSSFLEAIHLTDRNTGFLTTDRTFTQVARVVDSTTELVIFDDIEPDPGYNNVLKNPSFELIYHIEMHGVWADIFRKKPNLCSSPSL